MMKQTAPSANRALISVALVLIMVTPGPLFELVMPSDGAPDTPAPRADLKKWTFIIYLFSDSSQHGGKLDSYYDMVENLETKGGWSDENINVLVLQDREKWYAPDKDGNTYAYYIRQGRGNSERISLGQIDPDWVNEVNMGDRHTLISFGTYVIQHYPAVHYSLITRSAGWWPDNFGEDENDATYFDNTNVHEMRSVLAALTRVAGKRIDVLTIAGCTSGLFEWAYSFYPYVDYYVSSETYSIGSYWRIFYWIDELRKNIAMTPENFTKVIVNEYLNENRTGYNPYNSITASSTNMSKLKAVADAIDNMSLALMANIRSNIHDIWKARSKTVEIDNYLRVDTYEIALQIRNRFPAGSAVNKTATAVMELCDDMTVLARNRSAKDNVGINVSTARGLSLYFVRDRQVHIDNAVEGYRARLLFSIETHWLDFLDDFFSYYHTSSNFAVGEFKLDIWSGSWDMDGDGLSDDIAVYAVYDGATPGRGAKVHINGDFKGLTDANGWLSSFNFPGGTYTVTVVYGETSASTTVFCAGFGTGFNLIMDLIPGDYDQDGNEDDVLLHVHDNVGNGISGAETYSDVGWLGWTDGYGNVVSFNYKEGFHYVYAWVWGTYWVINGFISKGGEMDNIIAKVNVIDYSNNDEVNDLDIYVRNRAGDLVTGAIIYINETYLGETSDGRIMQFDCKDGFQQVDVYYKYGKILKDAYFKDVRLRILDLDGDGMEESASVDYDVDLKIAAMDVKVTQQIIEWQTGRLEGLYYDNFTAVKGRQDYRFINHTTDHTGYVNIIMTLMSSENYIMDQWSLTGVWLETSPNLSPSAEVFLRPTYADVGEPVIFNATNSHDDDGMIVGYFFDFGDGTNSSWTTVPVISHIYKTHGNFTINLMVRDDRGAIDNKSNQVTVWIRPVQSNLLPKARVFVRPSYVYPWDLVTFNGSTSEDPDGKIVQYDFSFGDGTTTGWVNNSTVTHIYNIPGNFSSKVKVKDNRGGISSWSNIVTVWVKERSGNKAPTAYLERRPTKARVNETITFNASGSSDQDGTIYRYLFDFGDGTLSGWTYEAVVTHKYVEPGYYTTKVMVEDDLELVSDWSMPRGVEVVGNEPPRAYLFTRPHYVNVGAKIVFNGSASLDNDGRVVQYFIDFGDGTISGWTSQSVITHVYEKSGNYTVQLWVRDDKGDVSQASSKSTVTVSEAPAQGLTSNLSATIVVIILFIILMVIGTIYEIRRARLKGSGYGVGPAVEDDRPSSSDGEVEEEETPEEEQEDEQERILEEREEAGQEGNVKPGAIRRTDDDAEPSAAITYGTFKVRCSECKSIIEVPKGPRPIKVQCDKCGKKGVIR